MRTLIKTVLMLLALASCCSAQLFELGPSKEYQVSHTTEVLLPSNIDTLRIFQAYPQPASWSRGQTQYLPRGVRLSPGGQKIEDIDSDGFCWKWEVKSPGSGSSTFQSQYRLRSRDRRFRHERSRLTWADFPGPTQSGPIPVSNLAEKLKTEDPISTLFAISSWISNTDYDGAASHGTEDVSQTIRSKRGHCGHDAELFKSLSLALGLPCRLVGGYRMNATSELWKSHSDWNRHMWVEIQLPQVGWVEMDPRRAKDPFYLTADLIRNPSFQSQVTWVRRQGEWSIHRNLIDRITAK